jgi:hypothetical protein
MIIGSSMRQEGRSRVIQTPVVVDVAFSDEKHEKIQINALRIA